MSAPARAGSGGPSSSLPAGALVADRFQVQGFSHAEPMAEVYQAVDTQAGQPVTLRMIAAPAVARSAVEHEVATAARIEHKNLTAVVATGVHDGRVYVATEAQDGHSLRQLIDAKRGQGQTVGASYAHALLAHVANGLEEAHKVAAHGALTPDAVWVNRGGRVKINDLGLARLVPALARQAGDGGIAPYVAPEVARGAAASPAADVYSLGAVLYELVTGTPPATPLRPASQAAPGVPPGVDTVVARALAAQPQARFRSPGELVAALGAAVGPGAQASGGGPVTARSFNVAEAAGMAQDQERWLVQKDKLDYGPFSLSHVMGQIQRGQFRGDDLIVDVDTGERMKIKDHPQLGDYARSTERQLEAVRRAQAEQVHEKVEKKKSTATFLILGSVVAALAVGGWFYAKSRKAAKQEELAARIGDADVDAFLKNVKFDFAQKKGRAGTRRASAGGGRGDEFSSAMNLGDLTKDGGDEILSNQKIQDVMMGNYKKLVPCIMAEKRSNPGLSDVDLEFVVVGSGKVTAVKVNGQQKGAFPGCVLGRMQSFSFPSYNGKKTIASWSMSMR